MPTPALDMVLGRLVDTLRSEEVLEGWTVETDRPVDDNLGRGELPHLNVIHHGTDFSQPTYAETLNRAEVDLTFTVNERAAARMGPRLREVEATLINLLFANRTLGGYVQDIQPTASSGSDEQRAENGSRTLSIAVIFVTPVGDQFTLVGANGLITA